MLPKTTKMDGRNLQREMKHKNLLNKESILRMREKCSELGKNNNNKKACQRLKVK